MSYAYRYGQNMLSLATGRNADLINDDPETEQTPVSDEMTEAVIDVLCDFLLDYEFGEDAARVVATLRSDSISEIGEVRPIGGYDLRVVQKRKEARQNRGTEPADPVAIRLLEVIEGLMASGTPEAQNHAVKLSLAAVRMNCGLYFEQISALVIAHGSLENISRLIMLRLLLGHTLDSRIILQCLDELDELRSERTWEYDQNWYKWPELLVQLIFAGEPLTAAQRLLRYDPKGQNHDEREIIQALGLCRHPDALQALKILSERCGQQRLEHEWCAAVGEIDTSEAGETLLSHLSEAPRRTNWDGRSRASKTVAMLAEKHKSVWQNILSIARDGDVSEVGTIADIIRHVTSENLIVDVVCLPTDRLNMLAGAISDALRDLCVENRPIPGESGMSDLVPRPITRLRATLFTKAHADKDASSACITLLNAIDRWRDGYGIPYEEERHPDLSSAVPWPQVASTAWQAASEFLQ